MNDSSFARSTLSLALFLALVYVGVVYVLPYVLPFLIGAVLAVLIDPVVVRLNRLGVPRWLASALVLVIAVSLLGVALIGTLMTVISQLLDLQAALPSIADLGGLAAELGARWDRFYSQLSDPVQQALAEQLRQLREVAQRALPDITRGLRALLGVGSLVTTLLFTFISAFFLSRDKRIIGRFLLGLVPADSRARVNQVKSDILVSAFGFIQAQLILMAVTTVLSIIGLRLIGARYAVLVGLLAGVLDIIPVVGPSAVFLPWAAFLMAFGDAAAGLRLLLILGIVTVVRQLLEARVVGGKIGLHPLAALISAYVGYRFFGPGGFFLGPLVAILLKAVVQSGLWPMFQQEVTD